MINTQIRSKWFIFLLGSMLMVSLLLSGCVKEMTTAEQREEKVKVEQYLEEKYGKKFTIEESHFEKPYLDNPIETITNCYPQDNKKIKVKVTKGSKGIHHDNYLLEYGMNEANMRMQNVLDDVYGKDNAFPSVSCGLDDQEVYEQKWGRTPSLDELMGKYSDQMHYKLYMAVFKDLKPEQFNDEFKNVYKLVEHMKSLKLRENVLSIYYYSPTYKRTALVVIREKGLRYIEDSKETYRIYIDEKNFNQINSPEDIKKYLKIKNNS